MSERREVPRIVIHLSLEDAPMLFIDALSLGDECRLALYLERHHDELIRHYDHALASIQARCAEASDTDLGRTA